MRTLAWLHNHELETGGIEAWNDYGKAYPEVTGYLIPSMFQHGAYDLALRCADWLVSIQQGNGGFLGLDGEFHVFDTAACFEGLWAAYQETRGVKYLDAALKAQKYIEGCETSEGYLKRSHTDRVTKLYTMRASGVIGSKSGADYWRGVEWYENGKQRAHYLAYACEGYLRLHEKKTVEIWLERMKLAIRPDGFMPYHVIAKGGGEGSDTTATLQWAILYHKFGMKSYAQLLRNAAETVIQDNGGLWHDLTDHREIAWAAKYYLDLVTEMGQ